MHTISQQQVMYHHHQRFRFIWLALLLAVMVTACGFQLRGERHLLPEMSVTYIRAENPHGVLAYSLRRQLEAAGARVTLRQAEATAVLEILEDRASRRVLSVSSTGKAKEFELYHEVAFRLLYPSGEVILPRQEILLNRDFEFDETDVLGKANEESMVQRLMQQDIVRMIMQRLEVAS